MDHRKHLGRIDDPIHLQVGGIEEFAFLYGLLIVIALGEALMVGLVEAVDFIFDWSAKCIHFGFSEPVTVHVAFSLVFDEVLQLICTLPNSSP